MYCFDLTPVFSFGYKMTGKKFSGSKAVGKCQSPKTSFRERFSVMPTLTLRFKDKNLKRFRFKRGTTINIGRGKNNQVIIENLAVSSHHARLDFLGENYLLTDLKSKNGTLVNEALISTCWLNHGDNIYIGRHVLVFAYTEDEQKILNDKHITDQTMGINRHPSGNPSFKNLKNMEMAFMDEDDHMGALAYLQGGVGEIELNKKLILAGKNPSSDIVIKGLLVGKTSFTINKRKDGYYLSYVSGYARPKVNHEPVKNTIRLNEFDTIDIGTTTFQFIKVRGKK